MEKKDHQYHVYISHNFEQSQWVAGLAKNLEANGLSVFLPEREIKAGDNVLEKMQEGLRSSKKAVLVVTRGMFDSGEIRTEFDLLTKKKQSESGFQVIPIVVGDGMPQNPFLEGIDWIDFRGTKSDLDPFVTLYNTIGEGAMLKGTKAFYKNSFLIPGPSPQRRSFPTTNDDEVYLLLLMDLLEKNQTVLLMAKSGRWQQMEDMIIQEARERFGRELLHIELPFCIEYDFKQFFIHLGRQCGFGDDVIGSREFTDAFAAWLRDVGEALLVVTGYENIACSGESDMISLLRLLNELFAHRLKILVCGGVNLAFQYYNGDLSYLSNTDAIECPERTVEEVMYIAEGLESPIHLDRTVASDLLALSGGHPLLLDHSLHFYRKRKSLSVEYFVEYLMKYPAEMGYLFCRYCVNDELRQKLCSLLLKPEVAPGPKYMFDSFTGRLYWDNLIKKSSEKNLLVWRSDALRSVGQRVLNCSDELEDSLSEEQELFITKISIEKVRHLKEIDIPLSNTERKHLIITGKNGSGKTSVLECLKEYLKKKSKPDSANLQNGLYEASLPGPIEESLDERLPGQLDSKTRKYAGEIDVTFSPGPIEEFIDDGRFVLAHYSARREAEMQMPKGIGKIKLKDRYGIEERPGKDFIQHIVNLKADQSFARDEYNQDRVKEIDLWFEDLQRNLEDIFEDPHLKLRFNSRDYNFEIVQGGKELFDFNTLADGHAAILSIVTDLILRMERRRGRSYDVQGVVLIDELEAHLHLSLQRKVFRLLTEFFPKVQFIVTTHSPFILNSVSKAVIFDLDKKSLLEDLSGYPYEGIVKGYFENDTYSKEIEMKVNRYERLALAKTLTDDEKEEMKELRKYLKEIPQDLAPGLRVRFYQIELKRKGKRND